MKTTERLFNEARERGKPRFADRQQVLADGFNVRFEAARVAEESGDKAIGMVTYEASTSAERSIAMVDQAFDALEHLRMELVQILRGERRVAIDGHSKWTTLHESLVS